jgi:exodeoxyribonuclease-3
MEFVTYNVNSITARLERVRSMLGETLPDVALLQETKVAEFPVLGLADLPYRVIDHSGGRWAGVAILVRNDHEVTDIAVGLPGAPAADEARWVEATVGGIRVASVYVPNGRQVGSETYFEKLGFLDAMLRWAHTTDGRAVVAGDMNVCPTDDDAWDATQLHGGTHVTDEERRRIGGMTEAGFVDVFRAVEPDEPGFTWWDYRAGAFHKGMGLRIDLALVRDLAPTAASVGREWRKPSRVPGTKPSDHAPLFFSLDESLA